MDLAPLFLYHSKAQSDFEEFSKLAVRYVSSMPVCSKELFCGLLNFIGFDKAFGEGWSKL